MVSHEQRSPVSRAVVGAAFTITLLAAPLFGQGSAKKFYPDDPLWREPAPRVVKNFATRDVDDLYDFVENSFITPRREGKRAEKHAALDANTLGDVPESPWYSNRHYYRRMSIEELKRGPGNSTPPANGRWRVISAKTNGVTPGFVIEDEHSNRYVLKLDPPDYPELASAPDVIGSKALYALGYNTPENYIVHFRREDLDASGEVTWRDATGRKHRLTDRIVSELLKPQTKASDGTYRGMASRYIPGELAGPFSYAGMRSDDPNDIFPHQDRRELRGLAVFAAWLNHHDTKAVNSMDSLVDENGRRYFKHYLMDFGDILGSDGVHPKYPWSGHEYTIDGKDTLVEMVTFGFYIPRWAQTKYPSFTGVGRFDSWSFDPETWKPNYPNPAFLLMDREDAFWAAKQVASFTDEEIRALVETGEYSDSRAAQWITESLIKRRDKIAAAWFSEVLPLDKFKVVDGNLTFEDVAAHGDTGKRREYQVRWTSWDGGGHCTPLEAAGTQVPVFSRDTQYLAATFTSADQAGDKRLIVYVRKGGSSLEVVGIDR
jgi:hypothetical protein